MLTILELTVNIIGGPPIWPPNEHKNLHFDNKTLYENSWGNWLWARYGFTNHLALFACSISLQEASAERKSSPPDIFIYLLNWFFWCHYIGICPRFASSSYDNTCAILKISIESQVEVESLRIKHIMYLSYSFGVTRAGKARQAKPSQAKPCPATRDFDELQQIRQSFFTRDHMSTSEWRVPVYGEGGGASGIWNVWTRAVHMVNQLSI